MTATIPRGAARGPRHDSGRLVTPAASVTMVCHGCGAVASPGEPLPFRCAAARPGDDVDHLLVRRIDLERVRFLASDDPNPFIRYRQLFRAWHVARAAGWADRRYVGMVRRLDDAIAKVDGHGFRVTPLARAGGLSEAFGLDSPGGLWVKDEAHGVGGSHKARHLMGVMLELLVAEGARPSLAERPLAIASCGNAALAAAVVGRAANRRLDVFVPPDADAVVLERLRELGARVEIVARRPGEPGDPTVTRLRAAVVDGAIPFTCQGPDNGLAIEGGETLGYELAEAIADGGHALDRLVIQVGGGALASSVAQGLSEARRLGVVDRLPRIDTVQTSGGWPLRRAYERLVPLLAEHGLDPSHPLDAADPRIGAALDAALGAAARRRSACMWPWDPSPHSVAHGILDDETYDWLEVVRAMLETGGRPLVVDDDTLRSANALAVGTTGIPADETGTSGVAGLLALRRCGELRPGERVGVLLTGIRRSMNGSDRYPTGGEHTTNVRPKAGEPDEASLHNERGRRR